MTRSAVWPSRGPTYRMTPSSTPSVPMKLGAPVPSQTRAFLITRSIMSAPLSPARFAACGTWRSCQSVAGRSNRVGKTTAHHVTVEGAGGNSAPPAGPSGKCAASAARPGRSRDSVQAVVLRGRHRPPVTSPMTRLTGPVECPSLPPEAPARRAIVPRRAPSRAPGRAPVKTLCGSGPAGQIGDDDGQLGGIDRLRDVHAVAGCERAPPVLDATVRGQGDRGRPGDGAVVQRAHPPDERVAVLARHLDVGDEHVGPPRLQRLETLNDRSAAAHLRPAADQDRGDDSPLPNRWDQIRLTAGSRWASLLTSERIPRLPSGGSVIQLDALLKPRSVAVLGASERPSVGRTIV